MKKFLISIIKIYQKIPGDWHNNCRFVPTCSNYAIEAINAYGAFQGSIMTIKRIMRCNPFGGSGYDPVPIKREKKNEKN